MDSKKPKRTNKSYKVDSTQLKYLVNFQIKE